MATEKSKPKSTDEPKIAERDSAAQRIQLAELLGRFLAKQWLATKSEQTLVQRSASTD